MIVMRVDDIVRLARDFVREWGTCDPFAIAENLGIQVLMRDVCIPGFTAHTIKMTGYPTVISINNRYSDVAKRALCAHELGHALLHNETINYFDMTLQFDHIDIEYEANLFAVALLCKDEDFCMPVNQMNNTLLKAVLDYNIYGSL